MILDLIHTIGIKQNKRKDSNLYFLKEIDELRQILVKNMELPRVVRNGLGSHLRNLHSRMMIQISN